LEVNGSLQKSSWCPRRKTFIYVNNRLEGNALETIYAVVRALEERESRRELLLGADRGTTQPAAPAQTGDASKSSH
jgi:hypothetical protein